AIRERMGIRRKSARTTENNSRPPEFFWIVTAESKKRKPKNAIVTRVAGLRYLDHLMRRYASKIAVIAFMKRYSPAGIPSSFVPKNQSSQLMKKTKENAS